MINTDLNIEGREVPKEEWKKISENENYEISSRGNVRFTSSKKLIKQYTYRETGYLYVTLYKNHLPKKYLVHLLMAKEFLGYEETEKDSKFVVAHKDLRIRNNILENLEIITKAEYYDRHLKNCMGDSLSTGIHPVSTGFNRFFYRVEVTIENLVVYLGTYRTKEEAEKVYNLGTQYTHLYVSPTQYRKLIFKLNKGIS